jgi:hypothetical protein
MKDYPAWLRLAASKGGKKSKRTITPAQQAELQKARKKAKRTARRSNGKS